MSLAEYPTFDELMENEGRKHRRELLAGLIVLPGNFGLISGLRHTDDWLREHGIDPEEIQLTPSEIAEAKKKKEEFDRILEARRKQAEFDRIIQADCRDYPRPADKRLPPRALNRTGKQKI